MLIKRNLLDVAQVKHFRSYAFSEYGLVSDVTFQHLTLNTLTWKIW